MSSLYVVSKNENKKINAERFILLYMPLEKESEVQAFLEETGLDAKFSVIPAEISVCGDKDDESSISEESIKSLVLYMKDDKVLFERKLKGHIHNDILDQIQNYLYGKEED